MSDVLDFFGDKSSKLFMNEEKTVDNLQKLKSNEKIEKPPKRNKKRKRSELHFYMHYKFPCGATCVKIV